MTDEEKLIEAIMKELPKAPLKVLEFIYYFLIV